MSPTKATTFFNSYLFSKPSNYTVLSKKSKTPEM